MMSTQATSTTAPTQAIVTRRFAATAERLFDAWLDPSKIHGFMFGSHLREEEVIRIDVDPRVGGTFAFVVRRQGEQIDHVGEYLELNRPHRLVFTWGVAQAASSSRVVIEIVTLANGCELTLTHELDPAWADYADRARAGWAKMIDALDQLLSQRAPALHEPLLVTRQIVINAPVARVWEVLTLPIYIKDWDDLPEGFGEEPLRLGRTIAWEGHATLTVTAFDPENLLRLNLYVATWAQPPSAYDIAYTYTLAAQDSGTLLTITVGDFAPLTNGQDYYDASVEFASDSGEKIKQLAVANA